MRLSSPRVFIGPENVPDISVCSCHTIKKKTLSSPGSSDPNSQMEQNLWLCLSLLEVGTDSGDKKSRSPDSGWRRLGVTTLWCEWNGSLGLRMEGCSFSVCIFCGYFQITERQELEKRQEASVMVRDKTRHIQGSEVLKHLPHERYGPHTFWPVFLSFLGETTLP